MKANVLVVPELEWFAGHGYQADACAGHLFDPLCHGVVESRGGTSKPDRVVREVFQRGCRPGDDVFRPAKVAINDLNDEKPCSHAG